MNGTLAFGTYATLLYLAPGVGYAATQLLLGNPVDAAVGLGTTLGALVFALVLFVTIHTGTRPYVGGVRAR
ncbi:hypothetical protein NDI85_19720 [Halomicroarcula sp. S1AR25-4]|uniref:hypothetical protein n=1 Tax=Haloarcula sp. S1AR25-4 TaxID=2950538 RepID=UPI0028755653|nr:hypothetical protein [Halomicroarcula sp. S1AR25-4]MDS0280017.1 hypothetical protein [Halomicroarcula sp. S1AR25-4]